MQQKEKEGNYNRYTIGKKLRKVDPTYKEVEPSEDLQEYINYLRINGVLTNKVRFGYFQTQNGLPYPGLVATELIVSNEVLVSVPKELLLTTRFAFLSPIQEIFKAHPQFYSSQFSSSSEDRLLLTYLLYEYQQGRKSQWYHLIKNLPREIDYLVFWNSEEQKLLQDTTLVKQAAKQKVEFTLEYDTLKTILDKYPQHFQPQTYSEENVQWIYTHLVTRCFGKYLQYVTMVPFCELFNHECVDVYYDFTYKPDNPSKHEESEETEPLLLSKEDQEDMTTSEGSYNSDDEESDTEYKLDAGFLEDISSQEERKDYTKEFEDERYNFLEDQSKRFNPQQQGEMNVDEYQLYVNEIKDQQMKERKEFNVKQSLKKEIHGLLNDVKLWIFSNIDFGDNFSIFFIAQMYKKLDSTFHEYVVGTKAYFMTREDMKRVQTTCVYYKNEIYKYSKDVLKTNIYTTNNFAQKKQKKLPEIQPNTPEEILSQALDEETEYFKDEKDWEGDKFDNFVMKCSRKDQFVKNSQVYFCYGRLSNRMMLMRYGMTLEHNKYDHIHLRVNYLKYIQQKGVPEIMQKIQNHELSKYKRFKIKHTTFPIDLVMFCKSQYWTYNVHSLDALFGIQDLKLDIQALDLAHQLLQNFLEENFIESMEENEARIKDSTVGYHELFAIVYRLERQRIIHSQLKLIKIAKEVFNRMHQKDMGFDIAALRVHDLESSDEFQTNRLLLARYFNMLKFNFNIRKQ